MPTYGALARPRAAACPDKEQRRLGAHSASGCSDGREVIVATVRAAAGLRQSMRGQYREPKEEMTNA